MGESWVNGRTNAFVHNFQAVNTLDTTYESRVVNNLKDFRSRAYVNPSIVKYAAYSNPNCVAVPKKIHINPNFKGHRTILQNEKNLESGSVHINPHFHRLKVDGPKIVQASSHLCNSSKVTIYGDEKKGGKTHSKTLINKQSQGPVNINSGSMQDKITPKISQCTKVNEPPKVTNRNVEIFGKSMNIKTRHKIVHVDNIKSQVNPVNSNTNSKWKVLNRYKLVNIGRSETETSQRSKVFIPGRKKNDLVTSTLKKGKEQVSAESIKPIQLKHSLKRNSSVNRITNLIKTKYIYPNRILWHRKRPTNIVRNSKHKLDKREITFETVKTNSASDVYHCRNKVLPKTVISHRVKTVPHLWKSPISKHKSQNHFIWRKREKREAGVKGIKKAFPNRTVVKIGGIMYKSSCNKLTRAKDKKREEQTGSARTIVSSKMRHHIVYVRGEKFLLDSSGKTLIRQPKVVNTSDNKSIVRRIDLGGVTFIQKSNNVLIRTNTHQARQLVHSAKQKSIALLHNLRKKSYMPCLIYQRFGICRRYNKGTCIYVHDAKNIDLCKKFLKGECRNSACLLSHNAVKEKIATCHFFLKGKCNKENCPYLHVKVNKKAVICRDFLQGFCNLGQNCTKRHIHQCPDFEEKGVCKRSVSCPYPHKTNAKRKRKNYKTTKFESKPVTSDKSKGNMLEKTGSRATKKNSVKSKCENTKKRKVKVVKRQLEVPQVEEQCNDSIVECIPKRVKLSDLPFFIPLQSE